MPDTDLEDQMRRLTAPFPPEWVKFRAGATSGARALALAYVDARVVQDRLDEVLGAHNWQADYQFLPSGSVACTLKLRLNGEWVAKTDVGGPSEQPDEGDRTKAAVSDSLKRAAVAWGVGRYLYRLPQTWVGYDPRKKQLTERPPLPGETRGDSKRAERPRQAAPAQPKQAPAKQGAQLAIPADGKEMWERLLRYDATLAKEGVCAAGELAKAVARRGLKAGYDADLTTWSGPAILLAVEEVKAFEARARAAARGGALACPARRPRDEGRDDAEVIDRDLAGWLVATAKRHGHDARMVAQRFGVERLGDLTVGDYRTAMAHYDGQDARAAQAGGRAAS